MKIRTPERIVASNLYLATCTCTGGIEISDVIITKENIKKKLSKLNPNKAKGPDGIPTKILRELCEELSIPLCTLFNKSQNIGMIPKDWKAAIVTPYSKRVLEQTQEIIGQRVLLVFCARSWSLSFEMPSLVTWKKTISIPNVNMVFARVDPVLHRCWRSWRILPSLLTMGRT